MILGGVLERVSISMTSMSIKNINTAITAFFIEHGELPRSDPTTIHDVVVTASTEEINLGLFDEIMSDFITAFGPVMDSLIHNLDQLEDEDRDNCERAIKALWNGDAETQHRISKLFKKKVSKKPETKSKAKKIENNPEKYFKTIGSDLRKALRVMKKNKAEKKKAEKEAKKAEKEAKKAAKKSKKENAVSPQVIFKKKVSPELKKAVRQKKNVKNTKKKALKLLVKTCKEQAAIAKKAEKEAKKAEKEAKKAQKEAEKAEKEAKKAQKEAEKAEKEVVEELERGIVESQSESESESESESDQDSSSSNEEEEEALRRIKSARPDLTDDGAMILLEKFKTKLAI